MTQGYLAGTITNTDDERQNNNPISITTYGALILPYDIELSRKENKPQTDPKETTKQEGKIKSALKRTKEKLGKEVRSSQNVKVLTEYMQDKRNMDKLSSAFGVIGTKFSGIAVAQALINGKVTSKEALDYLFMGFAPALGVQGSLMGYSGLNQMKDALFNGKINVGAFISGFSRTLKGITDFKDMITKENTQKSANIIEFDLTISHDETYQSDSPERRVQSGQSLNEYIQNNPVIINVQCALQEGKRYSKAEFRAILEDLRLRKETVSLILGDEMFDKLVLTNFAPTHDCTKSGMDYSLSFKRITRSDIQTDVEVVIQEQPKLLESDSQKITTYGGLGGGSGSSGGDISLPTFDAGKVLASDLQSALSTIRGNSILMGMIKEFTKDKDK